MLVVALIEPQQNENDSAMDRCSCEKNTLEK